MCIILTEPSNPSQAWQRSRNFISMQNTKISKTNWQFTIRSQLIFEHEAVTRTVHWLHSESRIFNLKHEKILLVLVIMSWSFPEFQIESIWRLNFLEASNAVLISNQVHQLVVNDGSMRIEETTTWRQLMNIKKLLLFSDKAMVALFCLLFEVNVFVHFFLAWEGNSVDSIQRIVRRLSKPVSWRVFHDLESFYNLRGRDVWACA